MVALHVRRAIGSEPRLQLGRTVFPLGAHRELARFFARLMLEQ